jgi:hypothetical protein
MQAIRKLRNLLKRLQESKTCSVQDQHYLLSQVREILEHKGYRSKYKILNLYCNWLLHTKISGSMQCYSMLKEVGEATLSACAKGQSEEQGKESTETYIRTARLVFNFNALRQQLTDLFCELDFPNFLFTDDINWRKFLGVSLSELQEKPLSYPDGMNEEFTAKTKLHRKAKTIYMALIAEAKKIRSENYQILVPQKISIELNNENKFEWVIEAHSNNEFNVIIRGLL